MILLVDAGNSRTKWVLADPRMSDLEDGGAMLTAEDPVPAILKQVRSRGVDCVAVCRVGSFGASRQLEERLAAEPGIELLHLQSMQEMDGLRNGYHDPLALGADRWYAMLGAWGRFRGGCLVVDAGTALTIDAIDQRGMHLGGYIVPGQSLQNASLLAGTAGVRVGGIEPGAGFGRNTEEAVAGGILYELGAMVERAHVELQETLDNTCPLVMTGGDAVSIAAGMRLNAVVDPHLVFRGMLIGLAEIRGAAGMGGRRA